MYIINTVNTTDNTVGYDHITLPTNQTSTNNNYPYIATSNSNTGGGNTANNGFLIAIEVIFSVLVLFILLFCIFAGIKRKKRLRRTHQDMIENAILQQERRIQLHVQSSSSTITTTIQLPPPSYSPPDPTNQLSNDTVSRLDHLLLENHLCTLQQGITLPKYSDLYTEGVNRSD